MPCARIHLAGAEQAALTSTCARPAVGVQEGVAHLSFGDQPLQLRHAREHARFIRREDHDRARVLHDQRADLRGRLGRELIARAALVGDQVGAQLTLLFARQRADIAGVAGTVFDRRLVDLAAGSRAPPAASSRSSRPRSGARATRRRAGSVVPSAGERDRAERAGERDPPSAGPSVQQPLDVVRRSRHAHGKREQACAPGRRRSPTRRRSRASPPPPA